MHKVMKAGYFIYLKLIYIYLFCKVTQECCNNMVLVPINRKGVPEYCQYFQDKTL